jgi:hypothetical protein
MFRIILSAVAVSLALTGVAEAKGVARASSGHKSSARSYKPAASRSYRSNTAKVHKTSYRSYNNHKNYTKKVGHKSYSNYRKPTTYKSYKTYSKPTTYKTYNNYKTVGYKSYKGYRGGYKGYGQRFKYGYYYSGYQHRHWNKWYYSSTYKCPIYWDVSTSAWYYWCAPKACYYPTSYISYAAPSQCEVPSDLGSSCQQVEEPSDVDEGGDEGGDEE